MKEKVAARLRRLQEIEEQLGRSEVVSDRSKYLALSREHASLSTLKESWDLYRRQSEDLEAARALLKEEANAEFIEEIQSDIARLDRESRRSLEKIESLFTLPDPMDHANVIVELRAGTGGDEAALFVGDCVRMYRFYADKMGWHGETLSCTPSEAGGYKEYILSFKGRNVHRLLQYEAGTHRVQRVPATEAQGRLHTSAITVAVLVEPQEGEEMGEVDEADLRIDTYRSSGAGGQHVNTTDSAVRITHIPTGLVVSCQEERSQHKNKEKALRILSARLVEMLRQKARREQASCRAMQVGSGDRSERIRTYNFPQNRLTDHRIPLTLHTLSRVMEGELEGVSRALVSHFS